jgi:formamidopyrimidine-DNA glycosylase
MPELAEVEWYRKQWNPGLGAEIVKVRLHPRKRIFRGADTRHLQRELVGKKFLRSATRGKQILFQFSGDNSLGIHLGMTGKIRIASPDFRPAKHDHLVLDQAERALVFSDSRQFGRVRFHHGKTEPAWWDTGVPEIQSPDFDQKFLDQFLHRHRKAPIKAVLLMQTGFPGIGNWMADEILWRARIHPAKQAGALTKRKRADLFRETKFVVRESLRIVGHDFSDLPKTWLIHQKWKNRGICPRHHILLRHAMIGGRTTAWCARCQGA